MSSGTRSHGRTWALVLWGSCLMLDVGSPVAAGAQDAQVHVKILAINDFHGQLGNGKTVSNRPVGGAAVLASYLKAAQVGCEDHCLIVHVGDQVGASPAASALIEDEPSIMFFNMLGNVYCSPSYRLDPLNNLVATVGNHEFDEGIVELQRLVHGGNHANGPFLESPYAGASFPYVCANLVDANTYRPILLPYVIKEVAGQPIAFIGAILRDTPTLVMPAGVTGLKFRNEVQSINEYARLLAAEGVHSIVVLLHQGGTQASYSGPTDPNRSGLTGDALTIVSALDDDVDVVLSAHTQTFTNALVTNTTGAPILVTQAYSAGTAYADIDVTIDRATRDIVGKTARIVTTYADAGAGLTPDAEVAALVTQAEAAAAPLVSQVLNTAGTDITRTANPAGEQALGNLIADAMIAAMPADCAFMNPGGIQADIPAGPVTWGTLQSVLLLHNMLVRMSLTGDQIYAVLEQQWLNQPSSIVLQISGLTYTWDNNRPVGARVVEVRKKGVPISRTAAYVVVTNTYLAAGSDNFAAFTQGTNRVVGPMDLDALVAYVRSRPVPFSARIEGRITRLN